MIVMIMTSWRLNFYSFSTVSTGITTGPRLRAVTVKEVKEDYQPLLIFLLQSAASEAEHITHPLPTPIEGSH